MEIKTDANGYEFADVSMADRVRWIGVPDRLAASEWDISSPGMISGPEDIQPIKNQKLREELGWLSQWSKSDRERFVILHAPKGHGKTTYAAATMRRCLGANPKPKWISWPKLVEDVTDSWGSREVGTGDILGQYLPAGFLVIDDFGKELTGGDGRSMRDWQLRIAFTVINGRYERILPTLITTELNSKSMGTRLDAAITSRLMQDSRWIDLSCQPDYRIGR